MRYCKKIVMYLLLLTTAVCCITGLTSHIQQTAKITQLFVGEDTKELLRQQQVPVEFYENAQEYMEKSGLSSYGYLVAHMLTDKTDREDLEEYLELLYQYHSQQLRNMEKLEQAIWEDLEYFPIPLSSTDGGMGVSFENSWMFDRSYGGNRGHEGTDIMASVSERGRYPVVSMTDGVVEKIGWLELGGYRIGIRSPSGGYFYYAHLYDYAKEFQVGEEVKAGELLGFMGDSGYGPQGTTGKFAVHLHIGLYVNDETGQEMSVNPYWVLKWLEPKRLNYSF